MTRFTAEHDNPSGTKTLLSVFVGLVIVRYALAGVHAGSFSVGAFDGAGAAEVIGVLGMLYAGRRFTDAWIRVKGGSTGDSYK